MLFLDFSHTEGIKDLRDKGKHRDLVRDGPRDDDEEDTSLADEIKNAYPVEECISTYRSEYCKDLSKRLGLERNKLPPAYSIGTLLNPLFGLEPRIVGSDLMTQEQYRRARQGLLKRIQDIYEATNPTVISSDDSSVDSLDGDISVTENENNKKAQIELRNFERYKKQKYQPTINCQRCVGDEDYGIGVGPVTKRGKDLPNSGKNLADYVMDRTHQMDVLRFLYDHRNEFPSIFIIALCEASRQTEEVGCERFFGLAGYLSSAKRSNLGVRNYERIAMLADILQHVYIDPDEIARQYLLRCKAKNWKKENTIESLKCFNLERVIEAEQYNTTLQDDVSLEQYMQHYQEECNDS